VARSAKAERGAAGKKKVPAAKANAKKKKSTQLDLI
jgi:hypothetical protein